MESDKIEIRPDLKDIENTIKHLYLLADYFNKNNTERWSDLWSPKFALNIPETLVRLDATRDKEFAEAVVEVYRRGKDTAYSLSILLPLINDITAYPTVKDYIKDVKNCQEWIKNDKEIISKCERIISEKNSYKVDYWAIKEMIKLHKEQLKVLRGLDEDLDAIKNSERYKIENKIAQKTSKIANNKNVFIIHGQKEVRWRELKEMLHEKFGLNPIVLKEQPDEGATIIEKFEKYAPQCSYAFAIFTPDDKVKKNDNEYYFQARPNVTFELGWFCKYLGRKKVMILLQEGVDSEAFSNFQGVLQKRFTKSISEKYEEIENELKNAKILKK